MSWRKITQADFEAALSRKEIELFARSSNPDEDSPVDRQLAITTDAVRGFVRSGRKCRICPEEGTLPDMLIAPALDIAVFNLLKRFSPAISEPRTAAYNRANSLMERIATGEIAPEDFGDAPEPETFTTLARPAFTRKTLTLARRRQEGI